MELLTDRLRVLPLTTDIIDAIARDRERAERLVGAIPPDWPDEELGEFLPLYARALRGDPALLGFGPWLVIERAQPAVVGSAGFLGRAGEEGEVELGFGIHAARRGKGYATEAAAALVLWALAQEGVRRVVAQCDRDNTASIRVLEKIGMQQTGERDERLTWASREIGPVTAEKRYVFEPSAFDPPEQDQYEYWEYDVSVEGRPYYVRRYCNEPEQATILDTIRQTDARAQADAAAIARFLVENEGVHDVYRYNTKTGVFDRRVVPRRRS